MKFLVIKVILIAVLLSSIFRAVAQKLPKVQSTGFKAPSAIKIDGRADDWDNKFQAENGATGLLYTMANDNKNLYLVMQASDPDVINRVVGGGITITFQKTDQKKDNSAVSITYPVLDGKTPLAFSLRPTHLDNPNPSAKELDSMMNLHNKLLTQRCKWIGTNGIKGVDTTISIYNAEGIKAASLFDSKKVYTLEIALPLKYIALPAFKYHLQINGVKNLSQVILSPNISTAAAESIMREVAMADARRTAVTDFWGGYKLVN